MKIRFERKKKKKPIISGYDKDLKKKPVPSDELDKDKFYYECDAHNPVIFKNSKEQVKYEKALKNKKYYGKLILIKMEMANGQFREFLAADKGNAIVYQNNRYVLDKKMSYFIIERGLWCYDLSEFLSLPLRKRFEIKPEIEDMLQSKYDKDRKKPLNPRVDTNELLALIESSDIVDTEASINPTTLKRFTDSEVIKQVLQGAMLSRFFKIMFVLIIIVAVILFILLALNLYSSGIIEKVGQMFHK